MEKSQFLLLENTNCVHVSVTTNLKRCSHENALRVSDLSVALMHPHVIITANKLDLFACVVLSSQTIYTEYASARVSI
jgi:hypothetical protein